MEALPPPADPVHTRRNDASLCPDTAAAAIQAKLGDRTPGQAAGIRPRQDHLDSNGKILEQQAHTIDDDGDHSYSPLSSSSPSAATTRVNSGLTEHGDMSIGDKLDPEYGNNIDTDSPRNTVAPPGEPSPNGDNDRPASFSKRVKAIRSLLVFFIASTIFMGLFTAFIVIVLIDKIVETPGGVFWDASKTNYIVSILSQASALLTDTLIRDFFAVLRPVLAAPRRHPWNPFKRGPGSSFATWVGLSPASGWSSVLQVAAVGGFLNPWCNMRLVLPIMLLAFGSILKFQANFEYYFIAGPPQAIMSVYAGLNPPNVNLLNFINASDLAMYEVTWSSSILGVSQFARDFPLPDCDSPACRAVFLPGGVSNVRQVEHTLNKTLYSVDTFHNYDTVTIYNASGMVVKYEVPTGDSLAFNLAEDCVYAGQAIDNGVQLCVKQDGESIIVGWSACPIDIYDRGWCNEANSTWRSQPIESGTRMSLFSQRATTSYDQKNQSIINVQVDDNQQPKQIALSADDYKQIIAGALQPSPSSTAIDNNNVNTVGYTIAWFHRTFIKSFRTDKNTVVSNLHNFLAVPVQFNIVAHIFANYTANTRGLGDLPLFSLPDDMISVARGGTSASRLAILPWTGWVFIAVGWALHVAVFVGIAWVLCQNNAVKAGEMGVQDLDAIRSASMTEAVSLGDRTKGNRGVLPRFVSWRTGVGSIPVPGRLRKWWVDGRDADVERYFAGQTYVHDRCGCRGRGQRERGDESMMEESRCVLDLALDPQVNDGISAWRLARAAQSVRIVIREWVVRS